MVLIYTGFSLFIFFIISFFYFVAVGISIPLIAFASPLIVVLLFLLNRAIIGVILYPISVVVSSYLTSAYVLMKLNERPLWAWRDGSFMDYLMYLHLKLFSKSPFYMDVSREILNGYHLSYGDTFSKGAFLFGIAITVIPFIKIMFAGIEGFVKEGKIDIKDFQD